MTACDKLNVRSANDTQRRGLDMCVIAVCLAIAAGAVFVQRTRQSLAILDHRVAEVENERIVASSRVLAAMNLRQTENSVMGHADCAQTLLEKTPRSTVIADIADALPAGAWLETLSLDSSNGDDATRVTMTGMATGDPAVEELIARLRKYPKLQDVSLISTNNASMQGKPLRKFRLEVLTGALSRQSEPIVPPTLTASIGR